MKKYAIILLAAAAMLSCTKKAVDENPSDRVLVKDYFPENVNNIPETKVEKAKFPIIDMHSHDYAENEEQIQEWIRVMDEVGVEHTAVMHCAWIGRPFEEVIAAYAPYKDRFRFWCCFDYTDIDTPEGLQHSLETLERYHEMGAVGIGELGDKGFGDLYARPVEGMGIHIDDPRVKPLLEKCAELRMPVSIHIGEPIWMYLPMDEKNDGLPNGAIWHVDTTDVNCLGYDRLVQTFENAVRENPQTLFIACHYLNMNHDYKHLGEMLDKYPNMYVDIAARVAEAAQTPRATREFILKYQDRILFGTDNGMDRQMYRNIFRVLETNDEHFYIPEYNYHWYLSGFNLPDEVLEKIYHKNAERILAEYK